MLQFFNQQVARCADQFFRVEFSLLIVLLRLFLWQKEPCVNVWHQWSNNAYPLDAQHIVAIEDLQLLKEHHEMHKNRQHNSTAHEHPSHKGIHGQRFLVSVYSAI